MAKSLDFKEILVRKPVYKVLPSDSNLTFETYQGVDMSEPNDPLKLQIYTQSQMLREYYPSGHNINNPILYPDVWKKAPVPGKPGKARYFRQPITRVSLAFQRIIKDKREEQIMFLIQQANIRSNQMGAANNFTNEVKSVEGTSNQRISNIEVSAYASPDGGVNLNRGLAEKRQDNTASLIEKNLKKNNIDADIDTRYTAQDWEGFKELVQKSNIQDKDLILRVLSMYSDPEEREREIKNISTVYRTLADDILPQLRRSRLTLNYEIIGKSDEEISTLARTNANQLNVEELLYAATLTNDAKEQEAIYTQATRLYPNDYRGYNNLGKLAYEAGDLNKAESLFKQAATKQDAPEVNNNLALVFLAKGDKATAEQYLGKASGAKELNETMGNLYVAQGQYDRAVNSFARCLYCLSESHCRSTHQQPADGHHQPA